MKEEVLRLSRVTYIDQGVTELNHFCLNIFAGEIMGLIPVNGMGLAALMRLLSQNVPIHYGYVYYRDQLVNHWQQTSGSYNRISIIGGQSGLADDLTVADNVFVLRQGFRKRIIHRGVLRRQLDPVLQSIGVQISADTYARDLSAFERVVVEVVKAVVAGNRLIVLMDAGTTVSDAELDMLHGILRHYAEEGISFLYVSQHYEEIQQVCSRAALMMNGQIATVLSTEETDSEELNCFGIEHFERLVRGQNKQPQEGRQTPPALELRNLHYGTIAGLDLAVAPGECIVLQDLDNAMLDDFLAVMTGQAHPEAGSVRLAGTPLSGGNQRNVAIIQKMAARTMLFPDLSYLDNLCFMLDHRLPGVWRHPKQKESIRREYAPWLGDDVFDKSIEELTQTQRYDLIYARVLLQRPGVAICVQPFMQADVKQRMHIWQLLEKVLDKQIAVVILAVNLADTLSLADRLVRVQGGRIVATYERSEFGALPMGTPWRYLWDT